MTAFESERSNATQVALWRKVLAGVLGVAGSFSLVREAGHQAWKVGIPIVALVVAALIVHRATLGPQLLARAIWWSNLGLGAILCFAGGGSERRAGIVLTWGCGLALLAISRKGLAEASERAAYAPAAFRSSLLLLMVLALADAQTFLLFSMVEYDSSSVFSALPFALGGLTFIAGFIGLYRIRVWGAIVAFLTALLLFAVVATELVNAGREIRPVILILTFVQMVAAGPMLLAVFTRAKLPSTPVRARAPLTTLAVLVVMAVSMYFAAKGGLTY